MRRRLNQKKRIIISGKDTHQSILKRMNIAKIKNKKNLKSMTIHFEMNTNMFKNMKTKF